MNLLGWTAALALGLQGAVPTASPLEPTGKWLVEGENDICVLSHAFGEKTAAMTLAFRPFPMNNQMEAVLLLPKRQGTQRSGKATVTLAPGDQFDASFTAFAIKGNMRVVHVYVDRDVMRGMDGATQITIAADNRQLVLRLPSARNALKILNGCEGSMLKAWGVNPDYDRELTAKLNGRPEKYFGPSDYPAEALRANASGRVVALLSVDATGRVASCRVVRSALNEALDRQTCTSARRIRYQPARGAKGEPVASWALLPVNWQLPTG